MTQGLCMSRNVGNSLLVLKAEGIISMNVSTTTEYAKEE